MSQLLLRLPVSLHSRLNAAAAAAGVTRQAYVRSLLEQYLASSDRPSVAPAVVAAASRKRWPVKVLLSSPQYRTASGHARSLGQSLSSWVRMAIASRLGQPSDYPQAVREELRRAHSAVNAVGGNLNQIARALNADGAVYPESLLDTLLEVQVTVKAVGASVHAVRTAYIDHGR